MPNVTLDPSLTAESAKIQAHNQILDAMQHLEQASEMLDQGRQDLFDREMHAAWTTVQQTRQVGRVAFLGDKPDALARAREFVEKQPPRVWDNGHWHEHIKLMDPRLTLPQITQAMIDLQIEGVVKSGRIGGGRTQWQRIR